MAVRLISTIALLVFLLGVAPLAHADDDFTRTVSVTGSGEVKVEPDLATVNLTVYSNAKKAEDAKDANDKKLTKFFQLIRRLGLDKSAASTQYSSLAPRYEFQKDRERKLVEYEMQQRIALKVKQLDKVGELLDKLVEADISRIDNVQYGLENEDQAKQLALQKAVANAKAKADLLARNAGANLGKVLTINEQGASYHPPMPMRSFGAAKMSAMSAPDAAPAPPSGEVQVNQSVSVTFELE